MVSTDTARPISDRGWTPDEREEWLTDILCEQLLKNDARSS
jgi:hypothetical protein